MYMSSISLDVFFIFLLSIFPTILSIHRSKCTYLGQPKNGHVICDDLLGVLCSPVCNDGFIPQYQAATAYVCNPITKKWSTYPPGYPLPWPDCIEDYSRSQFQATQTTQTRTVTTNATSELPRSQFQAAQTTLTRRVTTNATSELPRSQFQAAQTTLTQRVTTNATSELPRTGEQRSQIPAKNQLPPSLQGAKKSETEGEQSIWQRMLKLTAEYHLKKMKEDATRDVQRSRGMVTSPNVGNANNLQGSSLNNNYQSSLDNPNTADSKNIQNTVADNTIPSYSYNPTNPQYITNIVSATQSSQPVQDLYKQQSAQDIQSARSTQDLQNLQNTQNTQNIQPLQVPVQVPGSLQTAAPTTAVTTNYYYPKKVVSNNVTSKDNIKESNISTYDQTLKDYWDNYYRSYQASLVTSSDSIPRNPVELLSPETGKPAKSMFADDPEHIQSVLDNDVSGKHGKDHLVAKDTSFKYPSPPVGYVNFNLIRANFSANSQGENGSFTDKILDADSNPQQNPSGFSRDIMNEDKLLSQEEQYYSKTTSKPTRQTSLVTTLNPFYLSQYYQSLPESYSKNKIQTEIQPLSEPQSQTTIYNTNANNTNAADSQLYHSNYPTTPSNIFITPSNIFITPSNINQTINSAENNSQLIDNASSKTNMTANETSHQVTGADNSSAQTDLSPSREEIPNNSSLLQNMNSSESVLNQSTPLPVLSEVKPDEIPVSPAMSSMELPVTATSDTSNTPDTVSSHDTVTSNSEPKLNDEPEDDDDTYLSNLDISALIKELIKLQSVQRKKKIEKGRKGGASKSHRKSSSTGGGQFLEYLRNKKTQYNKGHKKHLLDRAPSKSPKSNLYSHVHPLPRFS